MVFSPAVTRMAYVGALLALFAGSVLLAQEAPPDAPAETQVTLVASGVGTLVAPGGSAPLPWIETPRGVLVALPELVDRLGGQLEVGAFGASFSLVLGDATFVLAPGSPMVTRGTDLLPLTQPPVAQGGVAFVPVDFVQQTWGLATGVTASWDSGARRLTARRPENRDLPVDVSVVHLEAVTTVVLRFPEAPRARIEKRAGGWDVVGTGDRFLPPAPKRIDDPLLRAVSVAADRIRVDVAPGVDAESYRLSSPDRIVFDLFRSSAATAPPAAAPGAIAPERPGIRTVVIDPGHGGTETGAIGPGGTMEKELTLLVARSLADRLSRELGVRVAMTRTDDADVGLDDRSAFANQNKADLFLSIHLNSTARGDAQGAETYFLSLQASDQRAADAAALENVVGESPAAPGSDEFDVQLMLWDLAQSRHLAASQRLATLIQEELNRQLALADRGVKQAPFRVLMGAAMPAVLIELGFISSAPEEKKLRDPAYRDELVATLVRAVARFKTEYEATPGPAPGAAR